jgi:hypothetical protein
VYSLDGISSELIDSLDESDAGNTVLTISSAARVMHMPNMATIGPSTKMMTADASAFAAVNEKDKIKILPGASVSLIRGNSRRGLQEQNDRRLITSTGNKKVLVVRITDAAGNAPTKNATQLSDDVFYDALNLKKQYTICSGGLLNFEPATISQQSAPGVVDVTTALSLSGASRDTCRNQASTALSNKGVSSSVYDYVMYVCPQVVSFGAAAYASKPGTWSAYSNLYASDVLVQMHEVGHNLGFGHSGTLLVVVVEKNCTVCCNSLTRHLLILSFLYTIGKGDYEYDDRTCMMGAHDYSDDSPRMCFNAAKSWHFGWYSNRHVDIDQSLNNPSEGYFHGLFIGIDDYLNTQTSSNYNVVGKVGSFYIMYNRKKGINSQVQGDADRVTVIEQPSEGAISWNRAQLDETTGGFSITGGIVIQVCQRRSGAPDDARVLVYNSASPRTCSDPLTSTLFLLTTMQDNNGADGNMFEVEAKNQLQITSFDVHFQIGGSYEVRVYTKAGKYAGSETNQNDWTLLQTTTVQANSAGTLTPLPALGTPVSLSTGETRSFYITTMNGGKMRYTDGASEGNVFKQDTNLIFFEGVGKRDLFGSTFTPRVWNGRIQYVLPGGGSPTTVPTPVPTPKPTPRPTPVPTPVVSCHVISCCLVDRIVFSRSLLHRFRFSPSTADKVTYPPTNTYTYNATNTITDSPANFCAYYATNTASYALGTCNMLSFSCHCSIIVSN